MSECFLTINAYNVARAPFPFILIGVFFCRQCSGDAAVDQNEKAYAEIIQMADKRRCAVNELIRVQEKAAVSQAEAIVDQLEKETCELRKREDELKCHSLRITSISCRYTDTQII